MATWLNPLAAAAVLVMAFPSALAWSGCLTLPCQLRTERPRLCAVSLKATVGHPSDDASEESAARKGFKPGKSRYEAFYKGQGDWGKEGAIDTTAQDLESELPSKPTNPFFVGYDDEELGAVWNVHANVYGAREDGETDAPPPDAASFLPFPDNPALEPQVRSMLQEGAEERKRQLESFARSTRGQEVGTSEARGGDGGADAGGDASPASPSPRRRRKGWGT